MQQLQQTGEYGGVAFKFVRRLATELSSGKLELPSSPEVVIRVRNALNDPNVNVAGVARVVGSEPALAARIMHLASSVALNPDGRPITDLKRAITRMGFNNVRSTAMAFAVSQLRTAAKLKQVKERLSEVWVQSTLVAAICYFVARRQPAINADEAMLAGLMHGIGKLYILGRADSNAELLEDPATLNQILRDWHASIGKAILEAWGFPEEVANAVGEQDEIDRSIAGHVDLTDVLTVSVMMAAYADHPADLDLNLQGIRGFRRLGLDGESCAGILQESARDIADLRRALGT